MYYITNEHLCKPWTDRQTEYIYRNSPRPNKAGTYRICSAARGINIIDQQDSFPSQFLLLFFRNRKCLRQISASAHSAHRFQRLCLLASKQDFFLYGDTCQNRDFFCKQFCLIISSFNPSLPVNGNRNQKIPVFKHRLPFPVFHHCFSVKCCVFCSAKIFEPHKRIFHLSPVQKRGSAPEKYMDLFPAVKAVLFPFFFQRLSTRETDSTINTFNLWQTSATDIDFFFLQNPVTDRASSGINQLNEL